jgi:hypothetical protein
MAEGTHTGCAGAAEVSGAMIRAGGSNMTITTVPAPVTTAVMVIVMAVIWTAVGIINADPGSVIRIVGVITRIAISRVNISSPTRAAHQGQRK